MANVEERVKQIIREQLDVSDQQLNPGADLQNDLGADSLDIVELIMALEEAFAVEIPDEEAQKIRTVEQVIEYVRTHQPAEARRN